MFNSNPLVATVSQHSCHFDNVGAAEAEAWFGRRRVARETCVESGQLAQRTSGGELLVMHTKSIAQVSCDRAAACLPSRSLAFARRFGVLFRSCKPDSL
jgi:hypothetical protein